MQKSGSITVSCCSAPTDYGKTREALEHALFIIDENDLEGGMSPKTPKEIAFLEIHSNYNLGYVYERLGERVKAIAAYKRAIELKPDFAKRPLRA